MNWLIIIIIMRVCLFYYEIFFFSSMLWSIHKQVSQNMLILQTDRSLKFRSEI